MDPMRALLSFATLLLLTADLLAKPEERPFPTEKTTILREGRIVYVVEGTLTIPKATTT